MITIGPIAARAAPLILAFGLGACAQQPAQPAMAAMPGMSTAQASQAQSMSGMSGMNGMQGTSSMHGHDVQSMPGMAMPGGQGSAMQPDAAHCAAMQKQMADGTMANTPEMQAMMVRCDHASAGDTRQILKNTQSR